jgi:carboxylesterase type B
VSPVHTVSESARAHVDARRRCHSGELYFVWGTLGQFQLPYRDANDLPMSQLAADTWTSFVRDHDPNPSKAYLTARGYTNTLSLVEKAGEWQPLTKQSDRTLRIMSMPPQSSTFEEEAQCDFLGLPFNYYG